MTPDEFKAAMQKIKDAFGRDKEAAHGEADKLLCQMLVQLGFHEGVAVYNSIDKWYA